MDTEDDRRARVTAAAPLLSEALSAERRFRSEVIWSDVVGAMVLFSLMLAWLYLDKKMSLPWTWKLVVFLPIWEIIFVQLYRLRYRMRLSRPDASVLHIVKNSVTQVENQIWLQRNVVWWRLLPYLMSVGAVVTQLVFRNLPGNWLDTFGGSTMVAATVSAGVVTWLFVFVVTRYVYWVAQSAALSRLEARRQELLTLLTSLKEKQSHP